MIEKLIPVSNIVVPPPDPSKTPFSIPFCHTLAESIEHDGLLHPPVVAPVPGLPDRYTLVCGTKRFYAMSEILKYPDILCRVANGLDDELVMSARDAENVFRMGLSESQLQVCLIEWQAIYAKRHPSAEGSGASQRQAAEVVEAVEAVEEATGVAATEAEKAEITKTVAEANKPFYKVLMETLGVSRSSANRLARIARNLDVEQVAVLHVHKATNATVDALAALGDKEAIDKAIKLIASGMAHDEACRQAGSVVLDRKAEEETAKATAKHEKAAKAAKRNGQPAPPPAGPEPPQLRPEHAQTDEEWLVVNCPVLMANLKRKGPFKRDAILYRRMIESLSRQRVAWKKFVAEAKHADGNGGFFAAVIRVTRAAHPSQWYVCEVCAGTGKNKELTGTAANDTCQGCYGAAYKMKLSDD